MVWTVTTGSACHSREIEVFTPRKLDPVALGGSGRLWGYLQGGHETADYYLGRDGTPTHAAVELHGRLFARLGLDQLDRQAFERLAAGCHPLTGQRSRDRLQSIPTQVRLRGPAVPLSRRPGRAGGRAPGRCPGDNQGAGGAGGRLPPHHRRPAVAHQR